MGACFFKKRKNETVSKLSVFASLQRRPRARVSSHSVCKDLSNERRSYRLEVGAAFDLKCVEP